MLQQLERVGECRAAGSLHRVPTRDSAQQRGGEIVTLPPAVQAELEKRLKPIGAEVTKGDPALKAFYEKIQTIAKKY